MPDHPALALHLAAALGALALGPVALWARQGAYQRPRLHRVCGYAWVTLMLVAALSALFIQLAPVPTLWGFSPVHLLVPATFFALYRAFAALARGDIATHRKAMQGLYGGACVTAGVLTMLPQRFLGRTVWGQWLGLTDTQAWAALATLALLAAAASWRALRPRPPLPQRRATPA